MLSKNDIKAQKLVFIVSDSNQPDNLKFRNSNICLYKEGKLVNKISCHIVRAIFIVGRITITSVLIKQAQKYGLSIFLLNYSLSTYAEIVSQAEGNYKLREIQYTTDKTTALELSLKIVENKILNQEIILKKVDKLRQQHGKLVLDADSYLRKLSVTPDIATLRGIEGNYAKIYFHNIFKELHWYRRAPRTKEDIPNLLLDIGYIFLFNYIDTILRLFGFDTYKGVYHQLFFQRKSLSCDIMEPMRPLVDYQLQKSYNLGQINQKDFKYKNGSYYIRSFDTRKKYAGIWMKLIVDNKVKIYNYILGYYRHILNNKKYPFPEYEI